MDASRIDKSTLENLFYCVDKELRANLSISTQKTLNRCIALATPKSRQQTLEELFDAVQEFVKMKDSDENTLYDCVYNEIPWKVPIEAVEEVMDLVKAVEESE